MTTPETTLPGSWQLAGSTPAGRAHGVGLGTFRTAAPANERECSYEEGSEARGRLEAELRDQLARRAEIPLVIGGEAVWTDETAPALVPHRRGHVLADVHQAGPEHVHAAIGAARQAWQDWHRWSWTERAAVFLRAAALVSGPYRERLVAATMLDQSKTVSEADADAACELADFFRFNVHNLQRLLEEQPESTAEAWNRMEYRALEGFVYAVTPFNFTAIGGHLPAAPALMGNVVVWKPSASAMVGASVVMEVLREAGLPDGVVNLVYGDPDVVTDVASSSPHLAGVHFTGSTEVFRLIWQRIGANMSRYAGFPRLVGETGGKDFVLAHRSADPEAVAVAVLRGGFEYQGQKCSAASRLYAPSAMWPEIAERVEAAVAEIRMGDVADFDTYVGAVINDVAFARHRAALDEARSTPGVSIVAGGRAAGEEGWFVEPTILATDDPDFRLLRDELFGPIVTAYVYDERDWPATLDLIDATSPYALTGSIFATDRRALAEAESRLEYAAGNLYVNDKPTGAVVGQQPFGGSRASGTNDKTGTILHLARWVTPRTVKETYLAPTRLPFRE